MKIAAPPWGVSSTGCSSAGLVSPSGMVETPRLQGKQVTARCERSEHESKGGNQSMRSNTGAWRQAFWTAGTAALVRAAGVAYAQQPAPGKKAPAAATVTESQAQASAILMRTADFLGGTQRFSVSVRAGYDAVQKSGQKIEFGEMRKVTLSRADRLRVEGERSDGARTLTVFNGKEIVLIDAARNVYATAPQPGGGDAP